MRLRLEIGSCSKLIVLTITIANLATSQMMLVVSAIPIPVISSTMSPKLGANTGSRSRKRKVGKVNPKRVRTKVSPESSGQKAAAQGSGTQATLEHQSKAKTASPSLKSDEPGAKVTQ